MCYHSIRVSKAASKAGSAASFCPNDSAIHCTLIVVILRYFSKFKEIKESIRDHQTNKIELI
jgi:hypothetical protein